MFSSVRPAYRCLPIGSLGGRDKITSLGNHSTAATLSDCREHERCHNLYSVPQIKIFEFIEGFPGKQSSAPAIKKER